MVPVMRCNSNEQAEQRLRQLQARYPQGVTLERHDDRGAYVVYGVYVKVSKEQAGRHSDPTELVGIIEVRKQR